MAVNLSPVGGVAQQFFSNNGVPLSGGLIYTYAAGTTTPQASYTSSSGGTAHSNPIVLNSAGRVPGGEIWVTDGFVYKFVLKDSNDVLIATYDNISGINSNFINFTNQQEIQTATAGQTVFTLTTMDYQPGTNSLSVFVDGINQYGPGAQYAYIETSSTVVTFVTGLLVGASVKFTTSQINTTSYGAASQVSYTPAGTGAVITNVQAKLRQTVSVQDFGAIADGDIATGVGTNNTPMFQAAINALGAGGSLYIPAGKYVLVSQVTVPSDFTITGAGTYQTFLIAPNAFNSDGLLKLNGAGGPPTTVSDLCVGGQVGGAGVSSIGINSVANGVFLRNLWLTGFKQNVVLGATDNFLLDSVSETPIASGVGIQILAPDVTVSNCVTYDCYVGLSVNNVSFSDGTITLSSIRSMACSYDGFAFVSSTNIQMSNCSVGHNNASRYLNSAVNIDTCSNVNISNFIGRLGTVSSAAWGIRTTGSSVINISNSQLSNWLYGIFITNGSQIVLNANTCSNNYSRGIYVLGADQVVISNNCCNVDGNVGSTDAGIYSNNSSGFALHNIIGNMCSQSGGGVQEYGIYANIVNNGASSGFTNIVGNICQFNGTANISTNGVTANISSTGNVA